MSISLFMEVMQALIMVSAQAIIVEATSCEPIIWHYFYPHILFFLFFTDESIQFELATMLQYIRLRPFRYNLCRIVPLNIYLPFLIITFSVTYVIVALQLTHFHHLNFSINILVLSLLHNRMKNLRVALELNSVPINITGRNEVEVCVKNIRKSLRYYNHLLNIFERLDKQLHYLTPEVLVASIFLEMFTSILKISSEAGIIAVTMQEVNEMKEILTTQLLRTSGKFKFVIIPPKIRDHFIYEKKYFADETICFELATTLQYMTLRPFRYDICRVVPLNINLPFAVIGVCTTNVIIALQLIHVNEGTNLKYILLTHVMECLYSLFILAVPAITVELAISEVDQIKKILTIQSLKASDACLQYELETALQYVSLRPFQYAICRVIPLNIRIPFSVAGICITYTIVLLQLILFT
ncbi:hypothetical protein HW555_013502 [Spodoptera exigua]|uniref:Gustatory receptor n=1 Tax=Spodoptera exigua TaxID=7107 RepID=A0A835L2G6_SPOEX|nr:hypothetical protein HW555_013502 [Spodoptera exigua]